MIALALVATPPTPVHAAVLFVDSLLDNTTDDTSCTLREAINAANNAGGSNTDCGALISAISELPACACGTAYCVYSVGSDV